MPEHFRAVGLWYEVFDQTTDEEVLSLLEADRDEVESWVVESEVRIGTIVRRT